MTSCGVSLFFVFGDQMMELSVASREAQEKHAEALLRVRTPYVIHPLSCQSCVGGGLVLGGGDAGWCGGAREHVRVGRLLGELTTRTPTPATHSRARHARSSSIDRMERMPL